MADWKEIVSRKLISWKEAKQLAEEGEFRDMDVEYRHGEMVVVPGWSDVMQLNLGDGKAWYGKLLLRGHETRWVKLPAAFQKMYDEAEGDL